MSPLLFPISLIRKVAAADLQSTVDAFLANLGQLFTPSPGPTETVLAPIGDGLIIEDGTRIKDGVAIRDGSEIDQTPELQNELNGVEVTAIEPAGEVDQLAQILSNLSSLIDGIFNDLQSSLLETGLPEPTRPNGNGVAFDKFLAIYRANQSYESIAPEAISIDGASTVSVDDTTAL